MAEEERDKQVDSFRLVLFRERVRWVYWGTAFMIAFWWSFFFLKALFNFDVVASMRNDGAVKSNSVEAYLKWVSVFTATAIMWCMFKVRKMRILSRRGKQTPGKLISIAELGKHGMVPATFVYTVDGNEYKFKKDVLKDSKVGEEVLILYDPAHPRTCEIL